jgi:antitoxin HicB
MNRYPFEVRPLADEDGGGFLLSYPDFNQCVSHGDTIEEVFKNGQAALDVIISTLRAKGLPVPPPNQTSITSGKFFFVSLNRFINGLHDDQNDNS